MGAERVRTAVTAAAILAVALGAQAGPVGTATAAGTLTVSGVVYWDQNDDGVQQAGEPGVPGVVIHWNAGAGTPKAVTGADLTSGLDRPPRKVAVNSPQKRTAPDA